MEGQNSLSPSYDSSCSPISAALDYTSPSPSLHQDTLQLPCKMNFLYARWLGLSQSIPNLPFTFGKTLPAFLARQSESEHMECFFDS